MLYAGAQRSSLDMPRQRRRDRLGLVGILLAGFLIRLPFVATDSGFIDVETYRRWGRTILTEGLASIFDGTDVAYPPLLLYVFGAGALVEARLAAAWSSDSLVLTTFVKLPATLADLATAWLVAWALRNRPSALRLGACASYALHPAIWYVSAYWGQTDSVYTAFLVASVVVLARAAVLPSWALYALALSAKPQSIVVAPLLVLATLVRHGWARLAAGLAVALVTLAALTAPWLLAGNPGAPFRPYTAQIGPARVDVSAYNLWYLLLGGHVHLVSSAARPPGLPFSFQTIGTALFGMLVLIVAVLVWRDRARSLALPAAVLNLGMFTVLTQVHERYMFSTVPFILLAAAGWTGEPGPRSPVPSGCRPDGPSLWSAFSLLSATFLFNLLTVASFAPTLWTNLIAPQPASLLVIALRTLALLAAALNTAILVRLVVALRQQPESGP